VRARDGETAFYPLVENVHEAGILRESRAPAPDPSHGLQREAQGIAERLLVDLDYVGVIAVELFDTADGLLANEVAPRVHNSGHWTQDGAATSQFENHLRAGLGWPLGSPEALGWSAMVNVLGTPPDPSWVLGLPGARLHLYDKEPRPGRKVGHVNVRGSTPGEVEAKLRLLREGIGGQAAQRSQRP
jgi:5-(carboxyamino)imidazole ribonucleotide synthase